MILEEVLEPDPSQIRRKAVHGVGTYEPRADEIIYDNFFSRDYELIGKT